jgi:hypothetical protein
MQGLWFIEDKEGAQLQFAVGFELQDKTDHIVVDAEDALIAALKVKMQHHLCPAK